MKKANDVGVFQLPDGFWGYRFKIVVNGKTVEKKRLTDDNGMKFKNKTAASKARKLAIHLAENGPQEPTEPTPPDRKTVSEIYAEYCEKGRTEKAYGTIRKQDSLWNIHLKSAFGSKYIDEISVAEVKDYLAHLYYKDDLAYRYVESFLKMFYLIFGQAYSRGYLPVDTYNKLCVIKDTKISMPKLKIDDDMEIVAFTNEECAMLDEYFAGSNAETAYLLGRYCGLRINEAYGLKWENVDLEAGTIRIEQQMQYQEGLIKLVPLKTRNARRTIYLNSRVKAHLSSLLEQWQSATQMQRLQQEQNKTIVMDAEGNPVSSLELVNCLLNGKIQTVNSMKYHSRLLQSKYGLTFKFHYLRHTYGTQLATMNIPAHLLCNQMGHGKIETTRRYYIAVSEDGIAELKRGIELL